MEELLKLVASNVALAVETIAVLIVAYEDLKRRDDERRGART